MTLLVVALDRDVATHLALAVRMYRNELSKRALAQPSELLELEQIAHQVASSDQEASTAVGMNGRLDDEDHDTAFLRREDVARLARVSQSTADRWVHSGALPSSKRGRLRRIARADFETFMKASKR